MDEARVRAISRSREEHSATKTGEYRQVLDMTHAIWLCSCGRTFVGSGPLGSHKIDQFRRILREERGHD